MTTSAERAAASLSAPPRPHARLSGPAVVLAVLLGGWELGVRLSGVAELLVPAPSQVAVVFWGYLADGRLITYVARTLEVLLAGMAIGVAGALVLTTFAAFSRFGRDLLTTLTSILNP